MLRKLIRYDFSSTWKRNTLLLVLSTVAAVIGAMAIAVLIQFDDILFVALVPVAFVSLMFALMAPFCIILVVAIHYHKKFFSDEAYLTFTLPATPGQHLTSKLITGWVWTSISGVVVFVNMLIIIIVIAISTMPFMDMGADPEVYEPLVIEAWHIIGLLGWILYIFIASIAEIALLYLSLTLSGNIATKHKVLVGIGVYMLVNTAASTVTSVVEGIMTFGTLAVSEQALFTVLPFLMSILYAGMSVASIWINHYILSRKLNLS